MLFCRFTAVTRGDLILAFWKWLFYCVGTKARMWGVLFHIWDSTYKVAEDFLIVYFLFSASFKINLLFLTWNPQCSVQATGTLALTRLPPSANSTEILVMDQFGAVGSRGHMAHNKSCSWPSGIILRRVSLDRYLTHKAGTRAVAFVPSAWRRVQTGMLQILHQLIGNLESLRREK